eukprot:g5821.t1
MFNPTTGDAEAKSTEENVRHVFRAIRRENLADVKRFLDEGGDIETTGGRFHSTLLTEACRFRAAKVIDLLLDRGAAANVSGGGFWTPLHYACSANSTAGPAAAKLVSKLIDHHAEVDATDFQGAEPNDRDNHQATPLHHAASNGRREVIAVLLSFGGDISAVDRELDTPLHHATRQRQRLAMSLLESAGADPEAVNCWGLLAGTLAPEYKMNPTIEEDGVGVAPCVACSGKKGFHYYFCRSEILEETPEGMVLGPDGLPAVGGRGTAKAKHGGA